MDLLPVLLFAIALSFDGFGVGVAYGIRGITIPIKSLLVISLTSATAIGISMVIGHGISQVINPAIAELIGAIILVVVGIWICLQTYTATGDTGGKEEAEQLDGQNKVLEIRIKTFGLIIQILKEPEKADVDKSGTISVHEAIMLGVALAMDAFGAGFGAAMAGFKPLVTPIIVGIVKLVLVSSGDLVGRIWGTKFWDNKVTLLPGCVLIFLGLFQIGIVVIKNVH